MAPPPEDIQFDVCLHLHGECLGPMPLPETTGDFSTCMPERACSDDFSSCGQKRFCGIFKLSERGNRLMIPKAQQQPKHDSPSKPFFDNPSLGIKTILTTVFRAKGQLSDSLSRSFTAWVAYPACENRDALAFTAGHCFTSKNFSLTYVEDATIDFGEDHRFLEVTGCFGAEVGNLAFSTFGFSCASKPLVLVRDREDLALFRISDRSESIGHFLLPCSAALECQDGQRFMSTFSYPCTQKFLMQAYEELVEEKRSHGIRDLYSFLHLDNFALYKLLSETFNSFNNGDLICSPGALAAVDAVHCFYKCSTVQGSSGAPVVPTHLQGYTIGTHTGAKADQDFNVATSTDSPAFVKMYSEFILHRLPPRGDEFWIGWNLEPFERWLNLHQLVWEDAGSESGFMHSIYSSAAGTFSSWPSFANWFPWRSTWAAFSSRLSLRRSVLSPISTGTTRASQNCDSGKKLKWESSYAGGNEVATPPPTIFVNFAGSFEHHPTSL